MSLTDRAIRALKPQAKPFKRFDERGLYLLVNPNGARYWRLKYRYNGQERLLSLGVYPDVSLKIARERREEARRSVADGIDPSAERAAQKLARADSFEALAREWYAKEQPNWVPSHGERIIRRLERDVFPYLGNRPISDLSAPLVLGVARRIVDRGAIETAQRTLQTIGQVMRFAVATGRAERDPTVSLRGALPVHESSHLAAVTDPKQLGELLRAIDGYRGTAVVRAALGLAPYVFVRPRELRHAEWQEIDFDAADGAIWAIPGEKMKGGRPHIVPLPWQAEEILRDLEPVTGDSSYIFPSARSSQRPMSENAVLAALRRMGFEKGSVTGHGFRATARTLLDEVLHFPPHLIEHQLAHTVRDPLGRAYNRTTHLDERRVMMQRWADYLDSLRAGATVLPLRRAAG